MPPREPISPQKPRRVWRNLLFVCAGVLLAFGGCTWHIVSAFLPSAPITVSPETTVLTQPVTPEGLVDYSAALNDAGVERVPAEQNAAALLIRAFGPASIGTASRAEFLQRLDATDLPDRGEYFVSRRMFDERLAADPIRDGASGEWIRKLDGNRLWYFSSYPWTRSDGAEMAAWIDANEGPLEVVSEAAARPECYLPIRDGSELLSINLSPLDFPVREAGQLLELRANLRMSERDFEGAWEDVLVLRRLARHMETSPFTFTRLIANELSGNAALASGRFARNAPLDAGRCRELLAELEQSGPPLSMESVIDTGERYEMLDSFQRLALQARLSRAATATVADIPTGHVDWDASLIKVNELFDRLRSAASEPDYAARMASFESINAEIVANRGAVEKAQLRLYRDCIFLSRGRATRTFSDYMMAMLGRGYGQYAASHNRALARYRLALLAFALATHWAEQSAYPGTLADLAPDYINAVPLDPFTEAAFVYKLLPNGAYQVYSVGENLQDENGATFGEDPRGDDLPLR